MKKMISCIVAFLCFTFVYGQNNQPCGSEGYRQFDFWIGE